MERLTWKQIIEKYPEHFVGLKNVIEDDKGNIESAELVFGCYFQELPEEVPEDIKVVFTAPCPFGAIGLGIPVDDILKALLNDKEKD